MEEQISEEVLSFGQYEANDLHFDVAQWENGADEYCGDDELDALSAAHKHED